MTNSEDHADLAARDKRDSSTATASVFTERSSGEQTTPTPSVLSAEDVELPREAADLERSGELDDTSLRRRHITGLRRIIFHFTPQWFLVTMGTGNVALTLSSIPVGQPAWLYWLTVLIFAADVLLFCLFLLISAVRYTLYPGLFKVVLLHPVHALYLGPFTVSFATIANLMVLICLPAWGAWMRDWIWAFWWLGSLLAAAVQVGVMFCVFRYHNNQRLDQMMSAWLLPSISPIVAAASGATIAPVLSPEHSVWTVAVSYVLWGMGVPMAMLLLAMYLHRLSLSRLPPAEVVFSIFLPLGPLAQGAHAIMALGRAALQSFKVTGTLPAAADAGQMLYVVGWLAGFVLWSFALVWLGIAIITMIDRRTFPYNLSWWAVVFPTGVFSMVTMQIGQEMPSRFFQYLGTVFTGMNVVVWLTVSAFTVLKVWDGSLFAKQMVLNGPDKEKPT